MSTAPNMATITAALERSLQNCSLSHQHQTASADSLGGIGSSSSSDKISQKNHHLPPNSDTALELNSHVSLPYHWEQCLDLKTGEVYYINWRNGMKAKEDPRSTAECSEDFYYSEDDDDSSFDSEESSTESSTFPSSRERKNNDNHRVEEEEEEKEAEDEEEDHVLVVAGCKSCLMYFMVPKQLEDCPKCTGQLLHFDRSDNDIL